MKFPITNPIGNLFTKKNLKNEAPKQDVVLDESPDTVVINTKSSFAKKLAIGVSMPLGAGLIAAATFGIMKFVPVASAGVHGLLHNPVLIPALIGVAAGVGAVFLGIAIVKAFQIGQSKNNANAKSEGDLKPSPSSIMLNHNWSEEGVNPNEA